MLKNILDLEGIQNLNKNEQKSINGGDRPILVKYGPCGPTGGQIVSNGYCNSGTYGTIYSQGVCWACY